MNLKDMGKLTEMPRKRLPKEIKLDFVPFGYVKKPLKYDPDAPKFVYRRNVRSFDRKTNRTLKGDKLILGKRVKASQKKQKGKKYPSTKPMIGWERIYVGKGKFRKRGPKSRNKKFSDSLFSLGRPWKPKFTKWVSTYDR